MHTGEVFESLPNPYPARQHGDIGNEARIAHKLIALSPGVASEHLQFSLVGGESENCIERGGLARPVGPDKSKDAARFDTQIDAVHRDCCSECLPQTACFYACHGFSAPSWAASIRRASPVGHPQTTDGLRRSSVLPPSCRGARWSRRPSAILRQETSVVRLPANYCVRRDC